MTKRELLKMLENVGDDEKLTFVGIWTDRDGFPNDSIVGVYKVFGEHYKKVKGQCGTVWFKKA